MKNSTMAMLIAFSVLSVSCNADTSNCEETSFVSEPVCTVGLSQLLSNQHYDRRAVRTNGYLVSLNGANGQPQYLLFASEEAAKEPDYSNAIVLGPLASSVDVELASAYKREMTRTNRLVDVVLRFRKQRVVLKDGVEVKGRGVEVFAVQTPAPPPKTPDL